MEQLEQLNLSKIYMSSSDCATWNGNTVSGRYLKMLFYIYQMKILQKHLKNIQFIYFSDRKSFQIFSTF